MMIVRATRDIAPNTEIIWRYQTPVFDGYDERQKKFRQHWGFECDCVICRSDQEAAKNSVLAKRKSLRATAAKLFQLHTSLEVAKIERNLSALAETYSQSAVEVPRLGLWDHLVLLAQVYLEQRQPVKAIDSALKALESLGYVVDSGRVPRSSGTPPMVVKRWGLMADYYLTKCWMILAGAYHAVAPDLEAQAVEYARISYKIVVGEDETFAETYRAVDYYRRTLDARNFRRSYGAYWL